MILAEKIMSLRKRLGWSQEELAQQLGVSRQSVSKWEATNAMPDITKVVQMSELFGVSVDYLLKDNADDEQNLSFAASNQESIEADASNSSCDTDALVASESSAVRKVSLEEASEYTSLVEQNSSAIALGVVLCIWSPIVLFVLEALSKKNFMGMSEGTATGIGLSVLLLAVAVATALFIVKGGKLKRYEYLESEELELQYGVEAAILRKNEAFENSYHLAVAFSIILIFLGVLPVVVIGSLFEDDPVSYLSVPLFLAFVGAGVFFLVKFGMIRSSYLKLLQTEDFTIENKRIGRRIGWFPGVYWCLVTAIYLAYAITTWNWAHSWGIWPVAAVLFAAIYVALRAWIQRKN
ncbi:helix-turn-helix domain-containing protein [Olegusella massiliensis]|uniref:helix-turn-helix domain-containing protein n=1 Tax=Olegusella massiliensis TaxID=1776381 RepID=UPI0023F8D0EE|nr:helix-turn-helix transcriptional regulator [Olegusella massiliensis]